MEINYGNLMTRNVWAKEKNALAAEGAVQCLEKVIYLISQTATVPETS